LFKKTYGKETDPMKKKYLRLILGDQLNSRHSWFKKANQEVVYLMMEMKQETNYVKHHIQKLVAFFSAMRNFKMEMESAGHTFIYYTLDDQRNQHDLKKNIKALINEDGFEQFEYQLPDEYRLDQQLKSLKDELTIAVKAVDTEHFYTERYEMKNFFEKKKSKQWLMESFYRNMRKKHSLLLDGDQPMGGKWNFDQSNRKSLPKDHQVIAPKLFNKDVSELLEMIDQAGVEYIGEIDAENFIWPTSRDESLELLEFFKRKCLRLFGDYQDAMTDHEWSLYHSRLSFSMNSKMISPKEVIDTVIAYWQAHQEEIDISQVEGFVRQIIGWREYMRGIYWAKMPDYENENQLNHRRQLPGFYWTAKTKMNCMHRAIKQSLDHAYAHHIQRLMITGNFALLANCKPEEVDEWYLGIYIDAIQWVELPNTRGMSQYADGGLIATKPYVSSANYIDKMSDHCANCHYSKSKKTGEKACPFNSLYWHFIDRHEEELAKNRRMSMMVASWRKRKAEDKEALLEQADYYLRNIDSL
jgi:deoxyribodipyrimidine photolyase-related protein